MIFQLSFGILRSKFSAFYDHNSNRPTLRCTNWFFHRLSFILILCYIFYLFTFTCKISSSLVYLALAILISIVFKSGGVASLDGWWGAWLDFADEVGVVRVWNETGELFSTIYFSKNHIQHANKNQKLKDFRVFCHFQLFLAFAPRANWQDGS